MDVVLLISRYLRRRRIALVAALFVALAVAAMVVITAVMDGFRYDIHQNIRGVEPDLTFRMKDPLHEHFAQVEDLLQGEMADRGGVLEALSPRLETVGFIFSRVDRGAGSTEYRWGVQILGVDWERSWDVIPLERIIKDAERTPGFRFDGPLAREDAPFSRQAVPGILVGRALAIRMRLRTMTDAVLGGTNDASVVTGRLAREPGVDEQWRVDAANLGCRLAGVFDSGRDDFDGFHVIMDRYELHELRYGPGSERPDCTTVHGRVTEAARGRLDELKRSLTERFPGLVVETWKDRNRGLMDALDVEKRSMSLVLGFIVFLSVCLVFGLLYMMVVEKTRDIGVLRSMGFSGRRVVLLFLLYGTALGVIGSALGSVAGVWLVNNLNSVMETLGVDVFNPDVPYRFHGIPAILDPAQVLPIAVGTVIMAKLAGALAARRAAVIDPVRCLRYE